MTSVIIGARKTAQLKDNLGSVDVKLDAEELKKLDEVSKLAPEYPGWMQIDAVCAEAGRKAGLVAGSDGQGFVGRLLPDQRITWSKLL